MFTKEKYCAVCGCPFSLALIRNPEHPDPNEDEMLALSNPYDSRVLPRELTSVYRPNVWCSENALIEQAVAYGLPCGRSMAGTVGAKSY